MRRTLSLLLLVAAFTLAMTVVSVTSAMACHKGHAHGQQEEVNVEPVQDDPVICGNLL
jgi:hypothetical protein